MSRHNARFKRSVVRDFLSGKGCSSREVADRHGVDHGTVRKWVAAWQAHGEAAFRKKSSHYDARFRLKVLQFMQTKTLSYRETAAVFDIRNPTLSVSGNAGMIRAESRHWSVAAEDDP
ncbi:helix-turn-helix domain-containing protein [Paraburkholderia sp. BL10I2N1]|uniref:helix-turn-helix domain-containing protein n=1 Tax=Paraburkholderia sp. BL10I2N1 TaxID=1938796 RepID=UPI00105B39C6|nr:helix-turn-helix domain-containing protein [Paraburkholderia sp. BL10I2N1]